MPRDTMSELGRWTPFEGPGEEEEYKKGTSDRPKRGSRPSAKVVRSKWGFKGERMAGLVAPKGEYVPVEEVPSGGETPEDIAAKRMIGVPRTKEVIPEIIQMPNFRKSAQVQEAQIADFAEKVADEFAAASDAAETAEKAELKAMPPPPRPPTSAEIAEFVDEQIGSDEQVDSVESSPVRGGGVKVGIRMDARTKKDSRGAYLKRDTLTRKVHGERQPGKRQSSRDIRAVRHNRGEDGPEARP